MTAGLTWITLSVVALVVLVLAVYLIDVALSLSRAHRHLVRIADGLEAVAGHTAVLPSQLPAINRALAQLLDGLRSVDAHLGGVARVLGR